LSTFKYKINRIKIEESIIVNEGRTTAIFAAVAAVALALAWGTKPAAVIDITDEVTREINKPLFKEFEDPDKAASLEIVKYDEGLGVVEPFQIARDKSGYWKIPSHFDYPADAAEQVRDATSPLVDLKSLQLASSNKGDHAYFGVLNPDSDELKIAEENAVGLLVRVKDDKNNVLADLIIGKQADKSKPNQHYVRRPSQDAVYLAEIQTTPFTTEFRKWIKGELLGVKSFDITSIGLRDYAILPLQNGGYGMSKNFDADLSYDTTKSKWSLARMVSYEGGQAAPVEIGPTQELKESSLNDLRTAVQGLEIVNVQRKPKGLAGDLKADKSLMENKESLKSLYEQGFFPQETPTGPEIYATGGETLIGTQAGVRYMLRFGDAEAKLTSDENKEGDDSGSGLRRYLLVTASLDESLFPVPDLQPVPETIEDLKKLEGLKEAAANPPAAEAPPSTPPQPEESPAPAKEDSKDDTKTDAKPEEKATEDKPTEEKPAEDNSDAGDKPKESADSCDPQDAAAKQDEPKKDAAQPEAKPAEQAPPAKAAETEEELKERLEATRERITKENQRKLDARNEKLAEARKKVAELNARFADWYYVVNESAYKKLKISRDQLIVEKGAAGAGDTKLPQGLPPGFNFPGQQ
jgi:Domain of unknown function (DUF4340)